MKDIKYKIEYEHLTDELIVNEKTERHFNKVKDEANKWKLELSDEEFRGLFELQVVSKGTTMEWIIHQMSVYKETFIDALIRCV